jgi:hypothetical protein
MVQILNLIKEHQALTLLIVSELLSLLPGKYNGITQLILNFLKEAFKVTEKDN